MEKKIFSTQLNNAPLKEFKKMAIDLENSMLKMRSWIFSIKSRS